MNEHRKKMIAPIVITVFVIIYYVMYFAFLISLIKFMPAKILLAIIPLCLGGGMIYACAQRIKEIQGGEEDDLGKY